MAKLTKIQKVAKYLGFLTHMEDGETYLLLGDTLHRLRHPSVLYLMMEKLNERGLGVYRDKNGEWKITAAGTTWFGPSKDLAKIFIQAMESS